MQRIARSALGAAWILVLGSMLGCLSNVPAPEIEYPDYRVGAPDQLVVTILPEPRIEQDLLVRPDGKVTVELVGDVQAGGRTTREIAEEIQQRITRFKRGAVVTVALQNAQSPAITVLGEVRRPSTFALDRQMRVAEAIGRVGGTIFTASDGSVRVIRSGNPTEVILVDMDEIRSATDLSSNVQLYAGDLIYVPPTAWARVGYFIQMLLFPAQPVIGAARSASGI